MPTSPLCASGSFQVSTDISTGHTLTEALDGFAEPERQVAGPMNPQQSVGVIPKGARGRCFAVCAIGLDDLPRAAGAPRPAGDGGGRTGDPRRLVAVALARAVAAAARRVGISQTTPGTVGSQSFTAAPKIH